MLMIIDHPVLFYFALNECRNRFECLDQSQVFDQWFTRWILGSVARAAVYFYLF